MRGRKAFGLSLAGCVVISVMAGFYQRSNPNTFSGTAIDSLYKDLTEEQKRSPKYVLAGLSVTEGLEANLFAAEPTLVNPTNIDVDYRGRVWVCEAYNYRPAITGNPTNSEGDRILILEDTDADGKSDKTTVFYQGKELNAPLGIWVMGNDVIVSQSPYVWKFSDSNGNGKMVGSEKFKLLYGIYHMQIMEGDVIATIKKYNKYISHYHTGGVPGRHEIDETLKLNYPAIMRAIVDTGYKGFVGQEFIPSRKDDLLSLKQAIGICHVG